MGKNERMARRSPRRATTVTAFDDAKACPCGLGQPYGECCGPAHRGHAPATAEGLMRSRFAAFALDDAAYVLSSWHPSTRPRRIRLGDERTWTGLEVIATSAGGMLDQTGTVEFRAHHRDRGVEEEHVLHEVSAFERHEGRWVYVAAEA